MKTRSEISKFSLHSSYLFEYVYYFSSFAWEMINEPVLEFFFESKEEPTDLFAEFLNEQEDLLDFLSAPFPKRSRLHSLCEHLFTTAILDGVYLEADLLRQAGEDEPGELLLTKVLIAYQMPHTSFAEWPEKEGLLTPNPCFGQRLSEAEGILDEYYGFLKEEGSFPQICELIADEMFFILFINRNFLRKFNLLLAESWQRSADLKLSGRNFKDGKLIRKFPPEWVKQAVYHRDRGRCSFCRRDVSGLLSVSSGKNYDHIVPLAHGGLNDVTNFQLLCEKCNNAKRHFSSEASIIYERWY